MTKEYLLILTTWPDEAGAGKIAERLVGDRLAACVSIQARMTSVYEWDGESCRGEEHLLLIKTRAARYADIEALIRESHPYELPEIIAVPLSHGLAPYLNWIDLQTTSS